jgi:ABC-2 type transport system permease protein
MSTATLQPRTPIDRSQISRPSMLRLTRVEMRKMVDTRAGFWLVLIIAGLSALIVTISIFAGPDSDRTFYGFFQGTLFPVSLILPVLGILLVTTEWSQRTALATFGLVPIRLRIAVAKFLAGACYAVLSIATSLLVSVIGYGIALAMDRTDGTDWSIEGTAIAGALLFQLLGVVSGVAFGMLLMNTPAAIVLFFLLPTALAIAGALITALSDVIQWLDFQAASISLVDNSMTSETWQHLATASLLWIVAPMIAGSVRLVRRELK